MNLNSFQLQEMRDASRMPLNFSELRDPTLEYIMVTENLAYIRVQTLQFTGLDSGRANIAVSISILLKQ